MELKKLEDYGRLIWEGIGGSHSYGMNVGTKFINLGNRDFEIASDPDSLPPNEKPSDVDVRGIFIAHPEFLFSYKKYSSSGKYDTFHDKDKEDAEYFELRKWVNLAIEGNPNVVEQIFIIPEHILFADEFGQELRSMRKLFLSKNAFGKFGSYAYAQMEKMNSKSNNNGRGKMNTHSYLVEKFGLDVKHLAHLVRLYHMGIQILEEGSLDTFRPEADVLKRIRVHGLHPYKDEPITLDSARALAEELNHRLEHAMRTSSIPNTPDFDAINRWVVSVYDRAYNLPQTRGVFRPSSLKLLPRHYEMVDQTTVLLVSNRLVRRTTTSEAQGLCIPHKDWFTGLHQFEEFKYDKTTIEHIHKFVRQFRAANPRHLDIVFAPQRSILYKHPHVDELLEKLPHLLEKKAVYSKAVNYIEGNLKKMTYWEKLKADWKGSAELPPVPKGTEVENASYMARYGYDTILAYEIVHTARMMIELLQTGTIRDSRVWEDELYAIKHCHFDTFNDFSLFIGQLLAEIEAAEPSSPLNKKVDMEAFDRWLSGYIQRFLDQLEA